MYVKKRSGETEKVSFDKVLKRLELLSTGLVIDVTEIAQKVNQDFDKNQLPLLLSMINAIVDDKKLELDWESFR